MTLPNAKQPDICPIFADLTLDEREQLLPLLKQDVYAEGDMILQEGFAVQVLWMIMRGRCEVVKACGGDREQQLAILEAGAVFGEMSFFNEAPHSASVRAMTEVEVFCLSRKQYDELQKTMPSVVYKISHSIAKLLAERLRKMDEWTCGIFEVEDDQSLPTRREEWREFRSKLYSDLEF